MSHYKKENVSRAARELLDLRERRSSRNSRRRDTPSLTTQPSPSSGLASPSSGFSVDQDMKSKSNSVQLQRSRSRVKQVEFELAVMTEVADVRTEQLRDIEATVKELKEELELVKGTTRPAPAEYKHPGQTGLRTMLQASQELLHEQQQEYNVNQDEVIELRGALEKNQNRLQDLEHERNIHLAKVSELLNLLQLHASSDIESELYVKSMKVAELQVQMEALRRKLEASQDRVEKLEQEREANMNMVVELSNIISPEVDKEKVDEAIANLKAGKKLSTKHAQLLTIQQLKQQVEQLEEEKASFLSQIASLTKGDKATKRNDSKPNRASFKLFK